jgi:hypothetical protein
MFKAFPGFGDLNFMGNAIGLLFGTSLTIGALLTLLANPTGARVVRCSCWSMIIAVLVMSVLSWFVVTESAAWTTFDATIKSGIVGGIIGGLLGGVGETRDGYNSRPRV